MTTATRQERLEADRAARGLSAQRATAASVPCPICHAEPGMPCNKRIARRSARKRLLGYHAERFEVAMGEAESAQAVPTHGNGAPAAPAPSEAGMEPRSRTRSRGPRNAHEFPAVQKRFREAQHRLARVAGNYLSTGLGDAPRRDPRIKLRPYSAAPLRVGIGPNAWADIKRQVAAAVGKHETGGALLGREVGGVIRVSRALPPAAGATSGRLAISGHIDRAEIARLIADSPGLQVVGAWHSHVEGDSEPSHSDMLAMADNHQLANIAAPLELIVNGSAWSNPTARAWVLTGTDDPRFDLEVRPADLTGALA